MRAADCHPDRRHRARGLCARCYASEPDILAKRAAQLRSWRHRNPDTKRKAREYSLQKAYGIGVDEYDEMLRQQGGACPLCLAVGKPLVVDHDHETGRVRGLLCTRCNVDLDRFEHQGWVERAVMYLAHHVHLPD